MRAEGKTHEQFPAVAAAKSPSNRVFGIALGTGFTVTACAPWIRHGNVRWWAVYAAAALFLIAVVGPSTLRPFARVWMRLTNVVNRLLTLLLMGLLFFLVITPVGMVRRFWLKDPLHVLQSPQSPSYWVIRPPGPPPANMANQF